MQNPAGFSVSGGGATSGQLHEVRSKRSPLFAMGKKDQMTSSWGEGQRQSLAGNGCQRWHLTSDLMASKIQALDYSSLPDNTFPASFSLFLVNLCVKLRPSCCTNTIALSLVHFLWTSNWTTRGERSN